MKKRTREKGAEGKEMMEKNKRMNPMGTTCDLQLVRHATIDIGRYWENLKAGIRCDLISNQIERYEKRMKWGERKEKNGVLT